MLTTPAFLPPHAAHTHTGVPPPEQLDRNPRRRVMSEEDQRYIVKLLARHGDDYKVRRTGKRRVRSKEWLAHLCHVTLALYCCCCCCSTL